MEFRSVAREVLAQWPAKHEVRGLDHENLLRLCEDAGIALEWEHQRIENGRRGQRRHSDDQSHTSQRAKHRDIEDLRGHTRVFSEARRRCNRYQHAHVCSNEKTT